MFPCVFDKQGGSLLSCNSEVASNRVSGRASFVRSASCLRMRALNLRCSLKNSTCAEVVHSHRIYQERFGVPLSEPAASAGQRRPSTRRYKQPSRARYLR